MRALLAFGGLDRPGGITPDLRNLERGLSDVGVETAVAGSLSMVLRKLRHDDHEIVHVFGCLPSATIFGALGAGRAAGRRVVWTPVFHPGRPQYWVGSGRHRPMQLFDAVAPRAARFVDAVVAATEEEAAHFTRLGAPRVELNPPVVDAMGTALRGAARASARRRLGVGDGPVVMLVAAHSARRKGLSFARDTLAELRRHVPDATLLLVGGGDATELEGALGVVATGWCTEEDLRAAFGCADVLFVPSRYEQFSRVIVEGWAHSLPAVAADGVGLASLVDRRGGYRVPFGDAAAAARALGSLLEDPRLARSLGRAGRALVAERFSLGPHVERMVALYEGLLAPAPSRRRPVAVAR